MAGKDSKQRLRARWCQPVLSMVDSPLGTGSYPVLFSDPSRLGWFAMRRLLSVCLFLILVSCAPVEVAVDVGTGGSWRDPTAGMEFVYIQPGAFIMGSPLGEEGRNRDEMQNRVTLTKGFYMQTTEVTQGQWKAIMGSNPSYFKECGDDCPVDRVSWRDAQDFIWKLNHREGASRYRLPTEAEWEYAARAGSTTRFSFGDSDADLDQHGWYRSNSGSKTHPVGRKKPNAWGLYDMHGNVWEWCQDLYRDYPSGSVTDPTGPTSSSYRVLRGGSWRSGLRSLRSANRNGAYRVRGGYSIGFRLLRTD